MSAPRSEPETPQTASPRLRDLALAALASTCVSGDESHAGLEETLLRRTAEMVDATQEPLGAMLARVLQKPAPEDRRLLGLATALGLAPMEILTVALAEAVEQDPLVGRLLAHVQAPVGGSRPTVGLLTSVFDRVFAPATPTWASLLNGPAQTSGLLSLLNEAAPLPERPVVVPGPVTLALAGIESSWPGVSTRDSEAAVIRLPSSVLLEAERHARALQAQGRWVLAIRTGSIREGRAVAAHVARLLGRRAAYCETDKFSGLGVWLRLRETLPVLTFELAPSERKTVPRIVAFDEPILVVCGPEGTLEAEGTSLVSWSLTVPEADEREDLWYQELNDKTLARTLAREYRHGTGRIAQLGAMARYQAALATDQTLSQYHVVAAALSGEGDGLNALAELVRTRVSDEAFVLSPELKGEMDALLARCRVRDSLARALGTSTRTRYRPGVRALFSGPSGTGKTLASAWIATQLGLPLYRVDLASVTSKYIGETEKNLSQLLARAEQAEVILLFDEADSLFGKRTDIGDSNDRFANAQTNYLLQRIENYDGIVLLTSNSQARFDPAFARRLDFTVDFPPPGPEERRKLWAAHLGQGTELTPFQINQLSALVDLSGGHIRNAVLAGAVRAHQENRKLGYADVLAGLEAELRKLGRQMPLPLKAAA